MISFSKMKPMCSIRWFSFLVVHFFLFCCADASGFAEGNRTTNALLSNAEITFQKDLARLQLLIEESLVWRIEARDMYAEFEEKIDKRLPLSHAEIELIHSGSNYYLEIREQILAYAHKHKEYVANNHQVQFAPGKGTRTTKEEDLYYGYIVKHMIDPEDQAGRLMLNQIKLSLAASLVLYDNYLVAVYPYQENCKLRNLINFDNVEVTQKLNSLTLNYLSLDYRTMVQKAIEIFEKDLRWRDKRQKEGSWEDGYLDILISGSLSYEDISSYSFLGSSFELGESVTRIFFDNLSQFRQASLSVVSRLFGNTMGLVEMREGKLKKLSKKELLEIEAQLEPLDILLEKTPFRLTDKFIPGYYGHVAVWVGGPEDWQKEGLDVEDNQVVQKHLARVKNNRKVVEALRQGVQINTLSNFMNIDDLVILRHTDLSLEKKKEYLIRAFAQVGKKYDFNFDVETDKRIVCSELAYVIFHDLDWQTEKAMGRFTISPDNVAQMALEKGPLKVVELYHDGTRVHDNKEKKFAMLLGGS